MCCCLLQVPEDEIEAVQELPHLVDLKASDTADLKVLCGCLCDQQYVASIMSQSCMSEETYLIAPLAVHCAINYC